MSLYTLVMHYTSRTHKHTHNFKLLAAAGHLPVPLPGPSVALVGHKLSPPETFESTQYHPRRTATLFPLGCIICVQVRISNLVFTTLSVEVQRECIFSRD